MFEIGDYIMYKTDGVCRVDKITKMDSMGKGSQKKLYYVLVPVKDEGLKIFSPVDNVTIARRPIMSAKEAREMIENVKELPEIEIENEKNREEIYKKALKSCDCQEWFRVLKTIFLRKQNRMAEGKKNTAVDNNYMQRAEELVLGELSVSLGMTEAEVDEYIRSCME